MSIISVRSGAKVTKRNNVDALSLSCKHALLAYVVVVGVWIYFGRSPWTEKLDHAVCAQVI